MASWTEIERIRKDPTGFRALAARLLKVVNAGFTEWETEFLTGKARDTATKEFSVRQAETLLEIRDAVVMVETWRGFSIRKLIQGCYEARLDLSETDEEWLVALRLRSATAIKRRDIGKLARLCTQLGLIETENAA